MTEKAFDPMPDLLAATCDIAAAYVSNNHVAPTNLPALVASIHASVTSWASHTAVQEVTNNPQAELKPTLAQIRKSLTPQALISFIDGMPYKTLKRHLSTRGLTPESYCERFGLPADYPMVAPSYSSQRSALAKRIGLGIVSGQGAKHRVK